MGYMGPACTLVVIGNAERRASQLYQYREVIMSRSYGQWKPGSIFDAETNKQLEAALDAFRAVEEVLAQNG